MPGKILGLDISDDSVTAVQVKSGLKEYQITACARVPLENVEGVGGALETLFSSVDLRSDLCIASVPANAVSFRNLSMPFSDRRKIQQTIPFEIEALLPYPVEEHILDFSIGAVGEDTGVLAASVKVSRVSEVLEALTRHGVDAHVLDIRSVPLVSWLLKQPDVPDDGLYLDVGARRHTMILFSDRRVCLIRSLAARGNPFEGLVSNDPDMDEERPVRSRDVDASVEDMCREIRTTLHAQRWREKIRTAPEKVYFTGLGALYPRMDEVLEEGLGIPAEPIEMRRDKRVRMDRSISQSWNSALMDTALALALRDAKQGAGFNFRKGEFEKRTQFFWLKKEMKTAVGLVIVILALVGADMGMEYYSMQKRHRMLDGKITEVFRATFPKTTRIVDPIQQMKVKIREAKATTASFPGINGANDVLGLLKDISERIPASLNVRVTLMVVDPDTVRLSGRTDDFNMVDTIKNGLEPSPYFSGVTINSANLDRSKKHVQFEIKLQRSK